MLTLALLGLPVGAQVKSVVKVLGTPNPVVQGQNVTLTTGVNWTEAQAPSGTISLSNTSSCSNSGVPLGSVTLGSATSATPGAATLTVSLTCAGTNSIVATYSGDATYSASVSQPLSEIVLSQFTPTQTALTSSLASVNVGQTVTFTARLTYSVANSTFPTGTVKFTDVNSAAVLAVVPVQTSGGGHTDSVTAASMTTSLAAGSHNVQAAYSGDNIYAASSSQTVAVVVGTDTTPTVSSVVTTQGNQASQNSTIAQNTWIEVHGTNLSQTTADWSKLDFSNGLPTTLEGVSATVNGKPAAIYYVSSAQVNILTPLDSSTGPVSLQLTTPFGTTTVVTPTMAEVSPSFLVLDQAGHVAARHSDYSLAGPATLSAPGYVFTPVKPGEVVLLYGVGFGQTDPAITDQLNGLGSLPSLPAVTIGGISATVMGAGLSSAGLYQLNVIVPPSAPAGDLAVSALYNGVNTQTGVVLTVQP
jgi:uncharacterized protein (TIGR03437 family)